MPIDLNQIAHLIKFSKKGTRVQSGSLPDVHYIKFCLGTEARYRSASQQIQAILIPAIDAYWEQWEKEIEFRAAEAGISPEEMAIIMLRKAGLIDENLEQ